MQLRVADALEDARKFITQLQRLIRDKRRSDYADDEVLELAVKMDLVLIAEALRRLDNAAPDAKKRIPKLPQMISFRNVLVHSYDSVDEESAWDTMTREIPQLREQIDAWAAELGMEALPE